MSNPAAIVGALGGAIPEPDLDPLLDAAARCFERYGIKRTSVPDIARELGVSRATVYRRGGSVDELAAKLLAREIRVALLDRTDLSRPSARTLVDIVATIVVLAKDHPVLAKLAADEPEMVGRVVFVEFRRWLQLIVPFVSPLLRRSMREGLLAKRDPAVVAEWLVRLTVSLVIAPPLGDTRALLDAVMLPVLAPVEPTRGPRRAGR